MKKQLSVLSLMFGFFVCVTMLCSCGGDDDNNSGGINTNSIYDVLDVNGTKYACFGKRCSITYSSSWDSSKNRGKILLPCGKLSDAEKGEFDFNYMFSISLKGSEPLKIGSRLENYSPTLESSADYTSFDYIFDYASGSATVTDKKDDEYITIRFDSFKFGDKGKSYSLNGTVQLDLDED